MNEAIKRAASVLLVLATVYFAYGIRVNAYNKENAPEKVLAKCIEATYGTTTEAMLRVYGRVPKCL